MIDELLSRAWRVPPVADAAMVDYPMPQPLDPLCYANGRFVDPKQAAVKQGWRLAVPAWKDLKGSKRSRFTQIPMLSAEGPGAELTLKFSGTAVGAYIVAGPDAGVAEARIDGRMPTEVNLLHAYSKALHYPRTVMLGTDLSPGPHTLVLRISRKTQGSGHAMRIMQFVVNSAHGDFPDDGPKDKLPCYSQPAHAVCGNRHTACADYNNKLFFGRSYGDDSHAILDCLPAVVLCAGGRAGTASVGAKSFDDLGGWVVDQQSWMKWATLSVAHGLGRPVADAHTTVDASRTRHVSRAGADAGTGWPLGKHQAPGKFQVVIDGKSSPRYSAPREPNGTGTTAAGSRSPAQGDLALHDLTGFEGRCDAIC